MPINALLVEDAVNQVQRLMQTQFNEALRYVYEEQPDHTINLDIIPPNRVYVTEAIEPLAPPAAFVVAENSDHDLAWQNAAIQEHSILVGVLVEDQEAQRLTRKTWRYAQAAWRALHDQAIGNIKILVRGVDYSAIFVKGTGEKRMFRKDATLRCTVLHAERF